MERMKHTGDYELDEINMLEQECADLEEDNKRLEEENKKLKLEKADLMGERDGLKMVVERLQKEIEELEKPHPKFSDFGGYDEDEHIVKDENTYRDLDL